MSFPAFALFFLLSISSTILSLTHLYINLLTYPFVCLSSYLLLTYASFLLTHPLTYTFLGSFPNLRKANISFVCPSVWNSAPNGWNFMKFYICHLLTYTFLGAFPNLRKATISFVMSDCQSLWNSAPNGWNFMKFDIWVFFENPYEKIKVSLKSDKNKGDLTWRSMYIFDHSSLTSSYNEKYVGQDHSIVNTDTCTTSTSQVKIYLKSSKKLLHVSVFDHLQGVTMSSLKSLILVILARTL